MITDKYGRCERCGKRAEKTPSGTIHQGHNVGCQNARRAQPAPEPAPEVGASEQCVRGGCTEPRAESRGPRPAKYCEAHKTQRSK